VLAKLSVTPVSLSEVEDRFRGFKKEKMLLNIKNLHVSCMSPLMEKRFSRA